MVSTHVVGHANAALPSTRARVARGTRHRMWTGWQPVAWVRGVDSLVILHQLSSRFCFPPPFASPVARLAQGRLVLREPRPRDGLCRVRPFPRRSERDRAARPVQPLRVRVHADALLQALFLILVSGPFMPSLLVYPSLMPRLLQLECLVRAARPIGYLHRRRFSG